MKNNDQPNESISTKFSYSINKSISIILFIFSLMVIGYNIYDYRQRSEERVEEITSIAKSSLPYAMWNMDSSAMDEVMKTLSLGKDVLFIGIIMDEALIKFTNLSDDDSKKVFGDFKDSFLYVTSSASIVYEDNTIGEVQIALSQHGLFTQFGVNLAILLTLAIFLIRLIALQSVKISRKFIFEPLTLLGDKASQIASGNFEIPLQVEQRDEIGILAHSLDKMRLSINQLIAKLKLANNELEQHNENLEHKVAERTVEVQNALKKQEELNRNILDSIQYAKLIQHSILPPVEKTARYLPDYFCYWNPKDIVGGDMYFVDPLQNGKLLVGVFDCTGHGVPGAFMTMIVATSLKTIIATHKDIESPGRILTRLNQMVKAALRQDDKDGISDDGLDAAICVIDAETKKLTFAGAKMPLIYIQNQELQVISGNRQSIGYKKSDPNYEFHDHDLNLDKETRIYMTSDGLLDQKGGTKGLPFGKKRLFAQLLKAHQETMPTQEEQLFSLFNEYIEGYERLDDLAIIGLDACKVEKLKLGS